MAKASRYKKSSQAKSTSTPPKWVKGASIIDLAANLSALANYHLGDTERGGLLGFLSKLTLEHAVHAHVTSNRVKRANRR